MIEQQKVIDQITVCENGTILFREVTRITEEGNQISQTYHRTSLTPGHDLTGQPANVVTTAQVAWTPEVIEAYQAGLVRLGATPWQSNGLLKD